MVLLMYWEDDSEQKRKARREEKLRNKKLGIPEPQSSAPSSDSVDKLIEVIGNQDRKIDLLTETVAQQHELLKDFMKEGVRETVIVRSEEAVPVETHKKEANYVRIEDVDVNILDTEGIETVGEETGEVTKGSNIMSQIKKLKRLKNMKETDND